MACISFRTRLAGWILLAGSWSLGLVSAQEVVGGADEVVQREEFPRELEGVPKALDPVAAESAKRGKERGTRKGDNGGAEGSRASAEELTELSDWVRWLCLMNLPPDVEDTRRWGKQRQVYDGFDLKLDGWRVDTKRRWKMVNDGTWSRYRIEFVEPAKRLGVEVHRLEVEPGGRRFVTSATIVAPLKLFGRVNQFARDVQLISVSAKADAVVAMRVDCEVEIKLLPVSFPPDVEFRPKVTNAAVELREFRVHEISQIHGEAAEWIGDRIREVLDRKLEDYRERLVEKMNQSIAKQQEKLRISASTWLSSAWSK